MILQTLALIVSVATAHAANEIRFTPANQMNIDSQILGAVHRIESSNGQCTSTRISSRGHYFTARHCLQHCLIRSGVFRWVTEQGVISYFERNDSKLGQARCEISVDGVKQEIEISATSLGLIIKPDEAGFTSINAKKFAELRDLGYTSEGDFVIYRAVQESPDAKTSCLSLNPARRIQLGETVQSLGFPSETYRPDGSNSDGQQMYYSRGTVTAGISENACVKATLSDSKELSDLKRLFDQGSSFMSRLDAVFGSSGTAVLNASYEVVGVLIQTYNHAETTDRDEDGPEHLYCSGSAKTLKLSSLVRYIPQDLMRDLHCGDDSELQMVMAH